MGDALARDAARRLSAEYERTRHVRHAPGNHAVRAQVSAGGVDRRIDDLTEEGTRRVLSGPERTTLSPQQHAPRREHPRPTAAAIPQPPPSLVTALHLAALRFRPVATIAIEIAIVVMVTVVVVVAPRVT